MNAVPEIYLASASPRRRALVQRLGRSCVVGVAPVDESALEAGYSGPATGLAEYLARAKALAAAQALRESPRVAARIVLGADTTVILDDGGVQRVLGKPGHAEEATETLRMLRGRTHTVVTGVAAVLVMPSSTPAVPALEPALDSASAATRVTMRAYGDDEIARYVASGDPLDKAGAYGVQHPHFQPVASVAGCYLCVVGLPLCLVSALLAPLDAAAGARTTDGGLPSAHGCPWSARCRPPFPSHAHQRSGDER